MAIKVNYIENYHIEQPTSQEDKMDLTIGQPENLKVSNGIIIQVVKSASNCVYLRMGTDGKIQPKNELGTREFTKKSLTDLIRYLTKIEKGLE